MATHSSVLAWRILGTGEPGGLLSMGSQSWTRLKLLGSGSSMYIFKKRNIFFFPPQVLLHYSLPQNKEYSSCVSVLCSQFLYILFVVVYIC